MKPCGTTAGAGVFICILCLSCDFFKPAQMRIKIQRTAEDYIFMLSTCSGGDIGVRGIRVTKVNDNGKLSDSDLCSFQTTMSEPIRKLWRYGSVPPNATMNACSPLEQGSYEVHASGGEDGGYRYFQIEKDGAVKSGRGSCD